MKRITAVVLLALAFAKAGAADLKALFINMPDSIMPTLTKSDRMDFIDYMESGMLARVDNKLGGRSVMTLLDENALAVVTSQTGRMDMALFRMKDGKNLICIIKTVTTRYHDSSLAFYTEDWTPVPLKGLIELPEFDDYLTKTALKSDSLDYFRKMSMLRLKLITATDNSLEFRYTSLDDIGEDADKYRSWIRQTPLRYVWNGKRFKRK